MTTEANEMDIGDRRNRFFIGVPFFLLVALVSPLLLLLAPVIFVACLVVNVNPFAALGVLWGVLKALRGTHVEVTGREHAVLVEIS